MIGSSIRDYFASKGISQGEAGERLGISQAAVSARLRGIQPFGNNSARKWAEEFGFNREFLIYGTGELIGESPSIKQSITSNSGIAINQVGTNNFVSQPKDEGTPVNMNESGEGFFTKLCHDLMNQILERDRKICCLEDEIENLKNKLNHE